MTVRGYPGVTRLARQFKTFSPGGPLADAAGLAPFNAEEFDGWLYSCGCSHGERVTGQFLLWVFNPDASEAGLYSSGRFSLRDALGVWDSAHRAIFVEWVTDPWWP